MEPFENLPPRFGQYENQDALTVLRIAFEVIEADGQLACQWPDFKDFVIKWVEGKLSVGIEGLAAMRQTMERVCGDTRTGELLIAAAKFGLDACLLGAGNPYALIRDQRDPIHDTIGVLIETGVGHLYDAKDTEPFDPTIRIDYDVSERVEERAAEKRAEREDAEKVQWLGGLIQGAVRGPEASAE